jgi:2-C-methyl-D-erythritol 4-phosphate cytidylyltransferase
VPVVCWSIAAAEASGAFDEILVVAAPARLEDVGTAVRRRFRSIRVVAGGATRTDSSWAALGATDAEVIAIHDAARPFVTPALFARCVASAREHGSGVAALPLADTVRRADEAGMSTEELEREGLWQVQTPQAFRRDVLERARTAAAGRSFTDDAAAVAASGVRTRMVIGERRNLKITTSEDLAYARELVAKELAFISGTTGTRKVLPQ